MERMTAAKLEELQTLAQRWRIDGEPVRAALAADVADVLCDELRTTRARLAALEPRCDICERPLVGPSERVSTERDGQTLVWTVGDCCERRGFRIPAGARTVKKVTSS